MTCGNGDSACKYPCKAAAGPQQGQGQALPLPQHQHFVCACVPWLCPGWQMMEQMQQRQLSGSEWSWWYGMRCRLGCKGLPLAHSCSMKYVLCHVCFHPEFDCTQHANMQKQSGVASSSRHRITQYTSDPGGRHMLAERMNERVSE